jgi:NAD(P)-dependent dehydrogenase (short-subunit alcohol dehydrogenase family)
MATSTTTSAAADSAYFSPYRPDGKLYGFICVVTGATLPLGRSICHELAAHGAACIYACSSSSLSPLAPSGAPAPPNSLAIEETTLKEEIKAKYPNTRIVTYPLEIADEQATLGLIDEVVNECGRLDVWVCAAGWLGPAGLERTGPGELQRGWEANALAPFFALKWVGFLLLGEGRGVVSGGYLLLKDLLF